MDRCLYLIDLQMTRSLRIEQVLSLEQFCLGPDRV